MVTRFINLKKLSKDLVGITKTLERIEETATVRTINIVATRSRAMIADDVFEDTGIGKGTAKRRIKIGKAKKNNPRAFLFISAQRVTYPNVRQIKANKKLAGVSFLATGKNRKRVTTEVSTKAGAGSVPFKMKAKNSGKKIPVYVLPGFRKNKTTQTRKVRAMYYSSLAHVARKDWQQKVDDFSIREFKNEYPKQIKKANFRGRG